MNKTDLLVLLDRMKPDPLMTDSEKSVSWHAHRTAEQLDDPASFSLLRDIIEENSAKNKKDLRRNAYLLMGSLLKNAMNTEFCQYFVDRLRKETDKYMLAAMLDRIALLQIPEDVHPEAIVECSKSEQWLVRHCAIQALCASKAECCREAARDWVKRSDERACKFEIIYANAALGYIGEEKDISLLEQHVHSRIRDVRDSARYAIDSINARLDCIYGMEQRKPFCFV